MAGNPLGATPANANLQLRRRRVPHSYYDPPRRGNGVTAEAKLARAAKRGDLQAVRKIVATNPDMNVDRVKRTGDWKTPLFFAAQHGHAEVGEVLMEDSC